MIFLEIVRKNLLIVLLVSLTYIIYASIFLKPWELKYFSLVDDGQVVVQSSQYFKNCLYKADCRTFIDQTFEFGTSRFRPSYWLINNVNYELFGNRAELHHLYRVYVVGLLSVLLMTIILLDLGVSRSVIFLGNVLFYSTISFTENIIRLGTNEPYQIIFLAAFSFLFLNLKKNTTSKLNLLLLAILLIWALLIKENNIAIIPAIFVTLFISGKKTIDRNFLIFIGIPTLVLLAGMFITKKIPSVISLNIPVYTSNYVTSPALILDNSFATLSLLFNTLSPFLKLSVLLIPFFMIDEKLRSSIKEKKIIYWLSFSFFFVAVMFPWKYVLDRYQLVGIFGLVVVMAVMVDKFYKHFRQVFIQKHITNPGVLFITETLLFVLFVNLFSRGFSLNLPKTINYRNWFLGFTTFESEQVSQIAKYSTGGRVIHLNAVNNINNWEFLYEVPIHLRYLYQIDPSGLVNSDPSKGEYVFVRSSLDSYLSPETFTGKNFLLEAEREYYIPQIDVLEFRREFTMKPIQIFITPPYTDNGYKYSWKVYKVTK